MGDFVARRCVNPRREVTLSVARECGLPWEEVYASSEGIASLALRVKDRCGRGFCMLPFCHTLEAEAMGAQVSLGDDTAGTRPGRPVLSSSREVLARGVDLGGCARLQNVLGATALLAQRGEKVMYCVSGPLSTLSCLVDLRVVFREWWRDPELAELVLAHLLREVVPVAEAAWRAGASALEYADPPSAVSIVGPRLAGLVAERFTLPLVERLTAGDGRVPVYVCPMAMTKQMREVVAPSVNVTCSARAVL